MFLPFAENVFLGPQQFLLRIFFTSVKLFNNTIGQKILTALVASPV